MALVRASEVRVGTRVQGLGYVVAITDSMYQQKDGNVIRCADGTLDLYFRTKPMSPTGLMRGVDNGKLEISPDDELIVIEEVKK